MRFMASLRTLFIGCLTGLCFAGAALCAQTPAMTEPRQADDLPATEAEVSPPVDIWDRIRRGYAMPTLNNSRVRDSLHSYSRNPRQIERVFERAGRYLYHIVAEIEQRGLPTELALLPFVESAFEPEALSHAKASGLWQFMPQTGNIYSLQQNFWRDERRDVLQSTRARSTIWKSSTHSSGTGSWRWQPTTGAKAASRAPSAAPKSAGKRPTMRT